MFQLQVTNERSVDRKKRTVNVPDLKKISMLIEVDVLLLVIIFW